MFRVPFKFQVIKFTAEMPALSCTAELALKVDLSMMKLSKFVTSATVMLRALPLSKVQPEIVIVFVLSVIRAVLLKSLTTEFSIDRLPVFISRRDASPID
jgi:hypothetical protein